MTKVAAAARARQLLAEHKTRAAEAHLHEFVRQAWHVLEPSTPFVDGKHIAAICEHLEAVTDGRIRNLIINMPPRHMKSLLLVMWMAWTWIRRPSSRWLVASYALGLSIRDNLKVRRLIESPWFRRRWGHIFDLTSDQNVKSKFENNRTGYRMASAVKAGVTGEGGDFIVVDDAHNVVDADSPTKLQTVLSWWDEAVSTRGNSPATVAKVIVGQRVNEGDLSGHAMQKGGYQVLCLPARYEPPASGIKPVTSIGWSDWRSEDGELLWPERFTADDLAALELALGSYGTAGQLQQRPVPRGGAMVKRASLRFYKELPGDLFDWLQSWDCTFKDLSTSDYVSGGVWARSKASPAHKYLVHRVYERLDLPATCQAIRGVSALFPQAALKLIEDKANGPAVVSSLKREVSGIVPFNPEGGKIERLAAVSPTIEAGNVWLPDPSIAPWVEDYIGHLTGFPRASLNDDDVDMTSMALLRYAAGGTVRIW